MAAIKSSKYSTIAQLYANAQIQIAGVADYYYDAAYEIVLLQVFDAELDLLQPFYTAYSAVQALYTQTPAAVIGAVGSLQAHVLNKARTQDGTGRYTNINYWLQSDSSGANGYTPGVSDETTDPDIYGRYLDGQDEKITVPQEFANISSQAGYSITSVNIT
jgi:hypothetical protein